MSSRLGVSYRTPFTGCIRDNGTGGSSGLYQWAERLHLPARLLDVPLSEAPEVLEAPSGNCIITMGNGPWSPTEEGLEETNWRQLRDWLSKGNTVLIVTAAPDSLPKEIRNDFVGSGFEEILPKARLPFSSEVVDARPETMPAPVRGDGRLTVNAEGPRWRSDKKGAAGRDASSPHEPVTTGPEGWQLAADERGGVLFRIPIGKGAAYLLMDDFAWTNAGLDREDNARVLADILRQQLGEGVLAFDEYRHGHGRAGSFLTYLFSLPGSSTFLWLAAIWFFLYLYGRNIRLRPAEEFVEAERRSVREYIEAVAQLYERARASPLVVEAVARRVRHLSRPFSELPGSVEVVLHEAEAYAAMEQRPLHPTAAIRLVKELIRLRKQLYGSRAL